MKLRISLLFLLLSLNSLFCETPGAMDFFNKGQRFFIQQDYYSAIEAYQEAVRLNPHYLEALLQLSQSYFRIEEYQEAQRFIEEAQLYGKNDLNILNMEGRILVGKNELAAAEEKFRQVISREPNNLDANLGMAEVLLLQGNTQDGAVAFRRSLILSPESKRALLSMMLLFDTDGDFEKAEIYLELALKYHAGDPQVFLQAAYHYLKSGQLEKALYYGENAVQMNPSIAGPDYLLSTIYFERSEFNLASESLQRELRRDPSNDQALFLLARTMEELEKTTEAQILYQRILKNNPMDETARLYWESLLRFLGAPAEKDAAAAADYHFELGRKKEEAYDFPGAMLEYRRARWMDPYHYDSWSGYSRILGRQGFPEKSLDVLRAMRESGYEDKTFLEELEMREHSHLKSLSDQWGIQQFELYPNRYAVSLFYKKNTRNYHYSSDSEYAEYFRYQLMKTGYLNLDQRSQEVTSFSDAYGRAREAGSDYFLVLENSEQQRSFFFTVSLYLTRTGRLINRYSILRMGNHRIQSATSDLAQKLSGAFVPRGNIVQFRGNQALLNLGTLQGVEPGQIFQVFKQKSVTFLSEAPWIEYSNSDYMGILTITETDENLSVGIWENSGPFTLVAEGDEAFWLQLEGLSPEEQDAALSQWSVDQDLKSQLLMLQ